MSKNFYDANKSMLDKANQASKLTENAMGVFKNYTFIDIEKKKSINNYTSFYNTIKQYTKSYESSKKFNETLFKSSLDRKGLSPYLSTFLNSKVYSDSNYDVLNMPWKSIIKKDFLNSDSVKYNETILFWLTKFESNIGAFRNYNEQIYSAISNNNTIKDGLVVTYNLDISNNTPQDDILDEEFLEKANDVIEKISTDFSNAKKAINNFLIEFFNTDRLSFTKSFIREIVMNIICAYLTQLMFPQSESISNSIINNNQVITNITDKSKKTVMNNSTTINLTINNLNVGDEYKTFKEKALKSNRMKNLKSFDEIPVGTEITIIKKYRKYIIVTYFEDGVLKFGYTEADGIANINK